MYITYKDPRKVCIHTYLFLRDVLDLLDSWQKGLVYLHSGGDVHGGGVGVVTALGLVHVIIGMDRSLAAQLSAQELDGSVRDHLVGVHVGLGARA